MIRIAEPRIGEAERAAVLDVLASGRLTGGPYTQRLEEAFARDVAGTSEAVAVSSGTAALHLALLAHDVGAGDEVITTPFSFQATANMVLAVGARPVFVDVGADGNIDPSLVEASITPRTKALLPVHLYGRLCDMPALCDIAGRHGLVIIEDAAQAHGAGLTSPPNPLSLRGEGEPDKGRFAGVACYSLYATKNLTAGEGGVIATNDPDVAARLRRLRSHGEGERYESIEVGYNYRITEVGAALAFTQLASLAEANQRRRENAAYLTQHLRGVGTPEAPADAESHVWHQYTIRVEGPATRERDVASAAGEGRADGAEASSRVEGADGAKASSLHSVAQPLSANGEDQGERDLGRADGAEASSLHSVAHTPSASEARDSRDSLQAHLRERGIEAMVYYPKTLPAQKLYRDLGYSDADLPVARRLAAEVLSLPVHPGLTRADLDTIIEAVNEWTAMREPGRVSSK